MASWRCSTIHPTALLHPAADGRLSASQAGSNSSSFKLLKNQDKTPHGTHPGTNVSKAVARAGRPWERRLGKSILSKKFQFQIAFVLIFATDRRRISLNRIIFRSEIVCKCPNGSARLLSTVLNLPPLIMGHGGRKVGNVTTVQHSFSPGGACFPALRAAIR